MIRWLLHRKLDSEEKKLGESVDYLRHVLDVSPGAFFRFASVMPFSESRKKLPAAAWFVAQIAAAQREDCGPCLQITVNLAQRAGVDPALLEAALSGDTAALPDELAEVLEFSRAVASAEDDNGELREKLRERYGERGFIELSYAIASARIPPTVKRALGYARSCRHVKVTVPGGSQ